MATSRRAREGDSCNVVGRRGFSCAEMSGEVNFCLTGELDQHLLTAVCVRAFYVYTYKHTRVKAEV